MTVDGGQARTALRQAFAPSSANVATHYACRQINAEREHNKDLAQRDKFNIPAGEDCIFGANMTTRSTLALLLEASGSRIAPQQS